MEQTPFSILLATIIASVIMVGPIYVLYFVITRNGRGHLRLKHRAARRAVGRGASVRVRTPITVTPIRHRVWVVVALLIGAYAVGSYLYF